MERPVRPTRRQAIGAVGAGAAAAWVAPSMLSVDAARAATVPPGPPLTAVAGWHSDFVAVTSDGRAFRSLDAGNTWVDTSGSSSPSMAGADLVAVTTDDTVDDFVVVSSTGQVWYTINAASSWQSPTTPPTISGVVAAAGTHGIVAVVDGAGAVWRSLDGGATWSAAAAPPTSPVTGMCGTNGTFVTVASDGQVFVSGDGDTWSVPTGAPAGSPPFLAVAGSNDDVCAVDGSGDVFHAYGAVGWTAIPTDGALHGGLVTVGGDGDGDFVAVAADGFVVRSTNAGTDWDAGVTTGPGIVLVGLAGDDDGRFVGFSADGAVSRSQNGGGLWQAPATPPA